MGGPMVLYDIFSLWHLPLSFTFASYANMPSNGILTHRTDIQSVELR